MERSTCDGCQRNLGPDAEQHAWVCQRCLDTVFCSEQCGLRNANHECEPMFTQRELVDYHPDFVQIDGLMNQAKIRVRWFAPIAGKRFREAAMDDIRQWEQDGNVKMLQDARRVARSIRKRRYRTEMRLIAEAIDAALERINRGDNM